MPISITLAKVKRDYLDVDMATTKFDNTIAALINGILYSAINYLDDENYINQATFPEFLEKPLCQQIAYEFRRRKDSGLSSVTVGEGNVQKFIVDEWLPNVKDNLDRAMTITI